MACGFSFDWSFECSLCFSFGCTAIFLLGGATKHTKPIPIFIRSGDMVAMFGPGRLNYHGVPRIMPHSWHSDVSCWHPLQLESDAPHQLNDVASSYNDSSNASSSCVKTDAKSLTKNSDLHERPSDYASVAFSDDLKSSGKRQLCSSDDIDLHVENTRGGGGGGGNLEKDFNDDSRVTEELVTDYLKMARININVRQVFSSSSSSSISSSSSCSLPLNHGS